MNEVALLRRCQAGEFEQFGLLYDAYVKKIYNFIYHKVHHRETTEDLTSQTFLKALEKIKQYDIDKSFQAWLYAIARNTVIDFYRTERQHVGIEDAWEIGDEVDIERDFDTKQKIEDIRRYMCRLAPLQREILTLRVWQEMSYREIAVITGKSEESCKMTFSRSLKELKRYVPLALLLLLVTKL